MRCGRRRVVMGAVALGGAAWGLAGCAGVGTLRCEVASFGEWPAGRKPGSYAFDRLPSQQAQPQAQESLEAAASPALHAAGFTAVSPEAAPELLVQLGARITRTDLSPWDDPLWWHGGFGRWRHGPWVGPSWRLGLRSELPRYEREAALLIRDGQSGRPLFEARVSNDSPGVGHHRALRAMFDAALKDFPTTTGPKPRTVVVALPD